MRRVAGAVLAGMVGAATPGCVNQDNARPLTADAFVSRRVQGRANPQPIDQPGLVITDGIKPSQYEGSEAPEVTAISPAVREVVGRPTVTRVGRGSAARDARAAARAATGPAPTDGGAEASSDPGASAAAAAPAAPATGAVDPSGQYVVFGAVLARVNDQPIYAHKVLTILDSALRAEAKQNDARAFRRVAAEMIHKQIGTQVRDEVVFAAAQKSLSERERTLADAITAQWRNAEITRAGGSLELAKRRWADEGWDFEERAEYQYRLAMRMVYHEKRIKPLVQVTASDIRRYYDANRDTLFTAQARVKFRVIRIDPRNESLGVATAAEAERLAREVRTKALKGDFDALAREHNDPLLKESGGVVGVEDGWMPRGTYVAEKVESAVWDLKPGQVTDVIEERGAYYVARLDEREDAKSRQFEEPAVQDAIRETLETQQLTELDQRERNRLIREAVIQEQPRALQTAVDMAMQRYAAWASAQ